MQTLKCKNCNAEMTIQDDNREYVFCQFCGAKLLLDDHRSSYRYVDEAKVKGIEAAKALFEQKLQLYEKEKKEYRTKLKIACILSLILLIVGCIIIHYDSDPQNSVGYYFIFAIFIIIAVLAFTIPMEPPELYDSLDSFLENQNYKSKKTKIQIPDTAIDYRKTHFKVIKGIFESVGFTNITCIPLEDVPLNDIYNILYMVDSIIIDGIILSDFDESYPLDAKIIIAYHSPRKE